MRRITRSYPFRLAARALSDFTRDNGGLYAAAVSYYVFLSLFPLLIFLVSVFGLVVREPRIRDKVVAEIIDQIPRAVAIRGQLSDAIMDISERSSGLLGLAGLVLTVWSASSMFGALRTVLNKAFDAPAARPFLKGKLMDVLSVAGVILLATASAAATAVMAFLHDAMSGASSGLAAHVFWDLARWILPLGVPFIAFLVLYRVLPNHSIGLRHLWPGAALAAVGFEACKSLFNLYVSRIARYEKVYGALGSVAAFLFFVFLVANVIILGAELSSELARDRAGAGEGEG